jgi:GalNAc-alpha-(1->4)-GalNAc-alpha-(1->3)-diNAcBac-PP-undecaprenol alpha-1,4-N-acetyl-D-galactosaminyltransferase
VESENNAMTRLTAVIPAMSPGGAERVMATMANYWAARDWEITLLTFDDGALPSFFPLDPRIVHRPLGIAKASSSKMDAVKNNLTRITTLRRAITASRPDVALSFLDATNVTTLLATRGLRVPVIVEEHTDPAQKGLTGSWARLRRLLYPRADRVVVLSEQARRYFTPTVQARTLIIPNPITVSPPGEPKAPLSRKTLIALGRLGPEKGFDLLLDAFARIAPEHPDWHLTIWGEGDLRADLEAQRARLGLAARVDLPGRTANPHDELRAADLFVMSSRREGFPMALGEAMACGLAVVSADCESGPRQIIRPGIDGVLVPPEDAAALAAALDRLMRDPGERARLAARAPEVLDRFGIERVMAIWESVITDVVAGRKSHRNSTNGGPRPAREPRSGAYDGERSTAIEPAVPQ